MKETQMFHHLLTIVSVSTLIYLSFSLAEMALGRYKIRGISLNDWIVDVGCYAVGKMAVPPITTLITAALTVKLLPHYANALSAVPVWAQFLAFVVFEDMAQYWYHRTVHTLPVLWPMHIAHHGAPYMGVRMSSRNSLLYQVCFPNHFTAAILVYLGFGETYVPYQIIKNLITTAAHSELRWDSLLYRYRALKPVAWVVQRTISTPATHFAHHAMYEGDGIGHWTGNFGNMLFFWDVLFGTAHISQQYPREFGLPWDPKDGPERWYAQIFYPLFRPKSTLRSAYIQSGHTVQPVAETVTGAEPSLN
jgi:sterol desaturase/sphingolipid hydroxylase (fatty acid hydroxylase superfamily)